jgi:hypothetical protein
MAPKKAKKSKAELEAERLAAEAQALKDGDLAAARQLAEERAAALAARKAEEAAAEFRAEELRRLSDEGARSGGRLEERAARGEAELEKGREEAAWRAYLDTKSGHGTAEQDINGYITEVKDRPLGTLLEAMETMEYTEGMVAELQQLILDIKSAAKRDDEKLAKLDK